MPQAKKNRADDRSTRKAQKQKGVSSRHPISEQHRDLESEAEGKKRAGRKQTIILVSVVAVVILAIVGIFYYIQYVVPFQRTVVVVDGVSIKMRYFLKRTQIAGVSAMEMLQTFTNELIIKQVAPQPPYNIRVTDEDVDEAFKELFRGTSETISDSEFKEWYRQQLNEIGFSDAEYRDLMHTALLRVQLHQYLAERVPTVAEQVYLHITQPDTDEMEKIWETYVDEEDLAELTEKIWQDRQSRGEVADLGWVARGAIEDRIEWAAFSLDIGVVSQPVQVPTGQGAPEEATFYLIMVSEKAAAREVDEDDLERLKARALDDWLIQESENHKIEFHGRYNGYDSETDAWIQWQLQRMAK